MSLQTVLGAIQGLPPGALVPVEWLREQLRSENGAEPPAEPRSLAGLTVEEVATELGRSGSTVRGWLIRGDLVGYKLGNREWRVRSADLVAFLDAQATGNGGSPQPALGRSGRDRIAGYRKILNAEKGT